MQTRRPSNCYSTSDDQSFRKVATWLRSPGHAGAHDEREDAEHDVQDAAGLLERAARHALRTGTGAHTWAGEV